MQQDGWRYFDRMGEATYLLFYPLALNLSGGFRTGFNTAFLNLLANDSFELLLFLLLFFLLDFLLSFVVVVLVLLLIVAFLAEATTISSNFGRVSHALIIAIIHYGFGAGHQRRIWTTRKWWTATAANDRSRFFANLGPFFDSAYNYYYHYHHNHDDFASCGGSRLFAMCSSLELRAYFPTWNIQWVRRTA